jgi:hypothetical protein
MKQLLLVPTLLCALAAAAPCQTVTLPVMRSSKSIEVTMLRHALLDVEKDSSKLAIVSGDFTTDSLKCDLAQIALAPYTGKEMEEALDTVAVRTLLRNDTARAKAKPLEVTDAQRTSVAQNASSRSLYGRELTLLGRRRNRRPADAMPQGLTEILQSAPSRCPL